MQTTDPLSALRDIHLPEPVPLWPLAIGWWIALAGLLLLAAGAWAWVRHRRRSLKSAALRELDAVCEHFERSGDPEGLALELSELLRRIALARFPRRDVASLHGSEWTEFFWRTSRRPELGERIAPAMAELENALYAPPDGLQPEAPERWCDAARSWIGGIA